MKYRAPSIQKCALDLQVQALPDKKQKERVLGIIGVCTRVWNMALEDREALWQEERRSTTYWQQCLQLTEEARADSSLRAAHMQVLQEVLRRLDGAYKAYIVRESRFPRFKSFREWGSFTYPQAYNGSVILDPGRGRLSLSKIGDVPVVAHREVPKGARLKTCVVKGEPNGRWFACLVFEVTMAAEGPPEPPWKSPIGVDLGLKSLVTTSDGEEIEPPKFLRKAEKRLVRLHRSLSRKVKRSRNWSKARRRLAACYSRISDQRRDFSHKLSARLARDHDFVSFEDLSVDFMVRNHSLAKSIIDASWGRLVDDTESKLIRQGKRFVRVPPQYTTQECYFCGFINRFSLDIREFACGGCGKVLKRDKNAGRIVLKRGILQVGQDKASSRPRFDGENPHRIVPELRPVETGPPAPPSKGASCLVGESGTICGGPLGLAAGSPHYPNVGGCHKAGALAHTHHISSERFTGVKKWNTRADDEGGSATSTWQNYGTTSTETFVAPNV